MALLDVLASVPPSIVYFSCFVIILTVLGAFALRLGFEEEPEYYEEVGPDGKVRVAFQFPPHETREQRRRRWARALRKRFWAGLAKCDADTCPQTEAEVERFLYALLSASSGKQGSLADASAHLPSTPSWDVFDPQVEMMVYQQPPALPPVEPEQATKMKKRLFSVVMNAGPPKALPPITEEQQPASADLETGSSSVTSTSSHVSSVPFLWDFLLGRRRGMSPAEWIDLDTEPIMTIGQVSATRSVLWAALRKLESMQ